MTKISNLHDILLSAGKMVLLQFTPQGKLENISPAGTSFFGWENSNLDKFNLNNHLLNKNKISAADFRKILKSDSQKERLLTWQTPDGGETPPLPVSWLRPGESGNEGIAALVKLQDHSAANKNNFMEKIFQQQAHFLPGFIHNLNTPLGTMFGRAELLRFKHPELPDLGDIIDTGYQLQQTISGFNKKINRERYQETMDISINQFLEESNAHLRSDLFFKHHVECQLDLPNDIPPYSGNYAALSGLFMEGYLVLRRFLDEEKNYQGAIRSDVKDGEISIVFNISGEVTNLPDGPEKISIETGRISEPNNDLEKYSLDLNFLHTCLAHLPGKFLLDFGAQNLSFQISLCPR